jgi:uncharacterized protein Smg (DUF494 family)
MKEKVVEILIYLMSAVHDNKRLSEVDVDDLRNQGYTQTEISAAFSWLYDNMPGGLPGRSMPSSSAAKDSRRSFHEAEKALLPPDGQGYLIQLAELGLLGQHDLETVIERIMMAGYEQVSVPELRAIVAAVLFGGSPGGDRAGRTVLNSGDTIH